MAQKKEKIPLTGQVRLPEALDRAIDQEGARLNKFKYEIVQDAWDAYLASSPGSERPAQVTTVPGPFTGLSDDQVWTIQNLIEILKEQPQGPEFQMLHQTLNIAVSSYRKIRSAHAAAKKKAPRESTQPAHRKPTGT